MHLAPVPGIEPEYPIAAVYRDTAPASTSPWVMPGKYKVMLTADGQKYTREMEIRMDPRVKTPTAELQQQFDLSKQVYEQLLALQPAVDQAKALRLQLKTQQEKSASPADKVKVEALSQKLDALAGSESRRSRRGAQEETLASVHGALLGLLTVLQDADAAPTPQAAQALPKLQGSAANLISRWNEFQRTEVPQLKSQLGIPALPAIDPRSLKPTTGITTNKDDQ
jgi:hypothetical protein